MMTNHQKKFIVSLKQKKFRIQHGSFVVEGVKMVEELLRSDYEVELIVATPSWENKYQIPGIIEVTDKELAALSSLRTPHQVLAVVKKKEAVAPPNFEHLTIVLDNVQDPGNLGTIIRTADWFGVKDIVCSENCVEVYNPKVIQATMGSFFRVNVLYDNLSDFLSRNKDLTVYGACLEGESIYKKTLSKSKSVLLMGNESQGISKELSPFINEQITIPRVGQAESLNVAVATAIFCAEFSRK